MQRLAMGIASSKASRKTTAASGPKLADSMAEGRAVGTSIKGTSPLVSATAPWPGPAASSDPHRQGHDPLARFDRGERRDARADGAAVDMHGAGTALRKPAAEARALEPEIVAQRVKQRYVGIVDRDRHRPAIHVEGLGGHSDCSRGSCAVWAGSPRASASSDAAPPLRTH